MWCEKLILCADSRGQDRSFETLNLFLLQSNASLENNIKNLARVLNGDIANFKDTILAILMKW